MDFNNGLILQFGRRTKGTITLPVAYTKYYSAVFCCLGISGNTSATTVEWISRTIGIHSKTLSTFTTQDTGYSMPNNNMWISIGY